jgi:hypothetical protein
VRDGEAQRGQTLCEAITVSNPVNDGFVKKLGEKILQASSGLL